MPITQDRMIRLADAGTAIVDGLGTIYRLVRDNGNIITQANAVREHTADDNARAAIAELINLMGAIITAINETINDNMNGITAIKSEAQYFARVQKKNERQAMYARQKRYVDRSVMSNASETAAMTNGRVVPEFMPLDHLFGKNSGSAASASNPVPLPDANAAQAQDAAFTQTPEYHAFQRAMREKYQRETGLRPVEGPDGVTRWLPPDDDLNARPINSDKDLL